MNARSRVPARPSREPVAVRILHNNSPRASLFGYTLNDTVTQVFAYDDTEVDSATSCIEIAERAFQNFAVERTPTCENADPHAVSYLKAGLRALSVGDVVCVDGRFFACEPVGWYEIDPPREIPLEHPGAALPD
ncbi:hypothetical protein REH65_32405 [Saccharopolyspora sp. ID03-671]|uniref:hypothetical protein n=1 Tax=Saccharopolyspora sp. ID03-671 TaxID=3073066 RepID=UPI00324636BB